MRWGPAWHRTLNEILCDESTPVEHRSAVRRELAGDPVAFALIYLSHHLKDHRGRVTFSEIHYEWARLAERWRKRDLEPQEIRDAFIAPRETGKSTWWFLILPMWAAANGHVRFAVAFAHADSQAQGHLASFKRELDHNVLLRTDYPDLCEPARKPSSGTTVADRQGMLHTRSGFTFAAKGIDSAALGMKVDEIRPDLLVFDDIEPPESDYSPDRARKRLGTITDAMFPLNIRARVVMVGTVTMPGSIMHQLVKSAHGTLEPGEGTWIADEKIVAHHHVPIVTDPDGTERSVWPEKWSLEWLVSMRHTRSYAKNYLNDPMGMDGDFWTRDDFRYGTLGAEATRWILQLDPAVTTKGTSDYTGWAVVAYSPTQRRAEIVDAGRVRLSGEALRAWVLRKLSEHERIRAVRVEVNQGGELWHTVLHNLPHPLLVHTSKESKEVRFAYALDYYQRGGGMVLHRAQLRIAEEEMVSFPRAPYDDVADACVSGVLFFLRPEPSRPSSTRSESYV
jgi:phage terminase large subunit-like protein